MKQGKLYTLKREMYAHLRTNKLNLLDIDVKRIKIESGTTLMFLKEEKVKHEIPDTEEYRSWCFLAPPGKKVYLTFPEFDHAMHKKNIKNLLFK